MAYFNHKITLKTTVAFMNLFTNIIVQRYNSDGSVRANITVPIQFANRDKYMQIIKNVNTNTDLNIEYNGENRKIEANITLPRLSVNITGFNYDSARNINKTSTMSSPTINGQRQTIYSPAPYNIDYEVTVLSKTIDDMFQIAEQIMPFYKPSRSINIKYINGFDSDSIPVILNSISPEINEEISYDESRIFTMSFNFTVKVNYYMPIEPKNVIKEVDVNYYDKETLKQFALYVAESGITPESSIIETIIDV